MIGTGIFNPAVSAVAGSATVEQSGLAAGVNDTFRQAGMAVGVAALGAVICAAGAVACAALIAGREKAMQPARELALDAA